MRAMNDTISAAYDDYLKSLFATLVVNLAVEQGGDTDNLTAAQRFERGVRLANEARKIMEVVCSQP